MRVCLAGQDHVLAALQRGGDMRVHLADTMKGNTPQKNMLALMAGHPYRLVSYFYLRQMKDPAGAMRAVVDSAENLVVDSGLYSFMFGAEKGTMPETYEAYRDYTRRYLDEMDQWGFPCTLVEADTHYLLGMDTTHRLREEFTSLGSRVMYVWHRPEGFDGLEKLARERDYIGLGIPELRMLASGGKSVSGSSKMAERMCNDLMKRVYKACDGKPPRIHLLGCTVESMMETQLAWSCDSTSWLSGIRFGQGCIWTPEGGLESAGIRSPKFRQFAAMAQAANPEATAFAQRQTNPDYYINCLTCAHAYALYQQFLDARYSPVPMRGGSLPKGPIHGRPDTQEAPASRGAKNRTRRQHRAQPVEPERPE